MHSGGLILLDFECAHAGDAAFDLGFFLSHLLLKTIRAAATIDSLPRATSALTPCSGRAYLDRRGLETAARSELVGRAILHVAACVLARVDGKSPVEYLDATGQAIARSFAGEALLNGPTTWDDLCIILETAIGGGIEWQR